MRFHGAGVDMAKRGTIDLLRLCRIRLSYCIAVVFLLVNET